MNFYSAVCLCLVVNMNMNMNMYGYDNKHYASAFSFSPTNSKRYNQQSQHAKIKRRDKATMLMSNTKGTSMVLMAPPKSSPQQQQQQQQLQQGDTILTQHHQLNIFKKPSSLLSILAVNSFFQFQLLLLLSLTFSLLPADANAAENVNVARGSEIFTGNCAGCHAGGMNFIKEKKNLKKDALERFVSPSLDGDEVKDWVMKSGQHQRLIFLKAPSGNGKLADADFADVTAFIVDQAVGDKW
jgi:cytochrome c6